MKGAGGERIGLLGGTFNPVHLGHLHAAAEVRRRFSLDRVLLIPSSLPPHKRAGDVASPDHRLQMVRLAVRGRTGFEVSAVEIEAGGRSYSIDTLAAVGKLYPEADLHFIMGIDAFLEFKTWKEYRRVLDGCRLIVISRPGFRLEDARDVLEEAEQPRICSLSGPAAPDPGCSIYLMEMKALNISSSEIRKRIREQRPFNELVEPAVEKYIKENELYRWNHE